MNTYKATYRSGAVRTIKAADYFEALQKCTLASGTRPESVLLAEDIAAREAAITKAAAAYRADR